MGSLEEACITGFLCRLCSQIHRSVIFIYGAEGKEHKLEQKINNYLPVKIAPTDPLPKTVCEGCMKKVIQHHGMIKKIAETQKKFKKMREEEMLLRQQLNGNNANATGQQPNQNSVSSGSGNTNNILNPAPSQLTSSTPAVAFSAAANTRTSATISPNLNRRITRYALRIHRQLNNDVNNYIENVGSSSSSSSEEESDSDSADGN
ncbi:uncharacterized protein LOC129761567 [Toxorhynchites rutilus septentrionalis]|uniref:uncharacterized protein LOC129761567 n=1 Tax=Toxorhynchites rutilus septentrionalis TaxID=329112 RepID=UPI00247A792C|nr:uncharacterized protein LOC129761567 [Toxorhynchites rutilus septentrionalis]